MAQAVKTKQNKTKLFLISKPVEESKFIHFHTLQRTHVSSRAADKNGNTLSKKHEEFCGRFKDFKKVENEI